MENNGRVPSGQVLVASDQSARLAPPGFDPERIVAQIRAQLANYDYLLPGDYVPDPPMRKRWFRWRPAFEITQDMLVWAGDIARARSLMDLKSAEDAIAMEAAKPLRRETGSTRKGDSAAPSGDRPEPTTHQDRDNVK